LPGVSGQENCSFGNAMFWLGGVHTVQRWQCHAVIVILKVDEQTESQEIEPTIMKLTKWQSAELIRRLALEALGTTN